MNEKEAMKALERGEIGAYVVVPEGESDALGIQSILQVSFMKE